MSTRHTVASFLRLLVLQAVSYSASAGFDPTSSRNVAVYWGQNSGSVGQQRLSYYCNDPHIDVILLAFMSGITPAMTNFANAGDRCTPFVDNSYVLSCPEIEADVNACQGQGKTVLISLGGAAYAQGGWNSAESARQAAQQVWDLFGPVPSSGQGGRPFGTAVVDGFDFDFESPVQHLADFAGQLRSLIDGNGNRKLYLSAAPQCPFPDQADGDALDKVAFDFVMVQFYNNYCGVDSFRPGSDAQDKFNLHAWDNWAKRSKNGNTKVLMGILAGPGAGRGYTTGAQLKGAIGWSKQYTSFGGVMMWDVAQLYANKALLSEVVDGLGDSDAAASNASPSPSSSPASLLGLVRHWGQCGGGTYQGPTKCQPPYQCTSINPWYSDCR